MNTTHAGCCVNVASSEACLVEIKVNCIVCIRIHNRGSFINLKFNRIVWTWTCMVCV